MDLGQLFVQTNTSLELLELLVSAWATGSYFGSCRPPGLSTPSSVETYLETDLDWTWPAHQRRSLELQLLGNFGFGLQVGDVARVEQSESLAALLPSQTLTSLDISDMSPERPSGLKSLQWNSTVFCGSNCSLRAEEFGTFLLG